MIVRVGVLTVRLSGLVRMVVRMVVRMIVRMIVRMLVVVRMVVVVQMVVVVHQSALGSMRWTAIDAPNQLSMLTTVIPDAQEVSIASIAVTPPSAAP